MVEVDDDLVGEWEFDPAHTRIGFSARHAMVTKVRGAFNEIEGRMLVHPDGPARSSVTVRLAAASVDTRNPQRDAHLRSADFFDAERHPDIVFRSTLIDEVEPRMFMVVGTLTIRDTSHEVAIPIELRGVGRGADGELRAGFEGTRRVDRRDWGLEWQVALDTGSVLVSERVTMEFEISAVKLPAATGGDTQVTAPGTGALTDAHTTVTATTGSPRTPAGTGTPAQRGRSGGRHRAPGGWFSRVRGMRR
ncbi:YceI family protein [Georgenia sp. H159]|uniref:YceI family protein n=1 Tax=Georgenia sp. H159 TaxID=3076115 RepID=UPI002D785A53|nr:YceI family protein [Georgenia sp. H159]